MFLQDTNGQLVMSTIKDPVKASRRVGKARLQARINALKKRAQRDLDRLRELSRLSRQAEPGESPDEVVRGGKSMK